MLLHVAAAPSLAQPEAGCQDKNPDPREDPKSRSLKGVPIKYPLVARVPN